MRKTIRNACSGLAIVPLVLMLAAPSTVWAEEPSGEPLVATLSDTIEAEAQSGAAPQEISAAADLPTSGPGSLTFDAEARLSVTLLFEATPSEAMLAEVEQFAVIERVLTVFPSAEVWADPAQLSDLESIPGVISVIPGLRPTVGGQLAPTTAEALTSSLSQMSDGRDLSVAADIPESTCGPIPIEADLPLRADLARAAYGVDGTGITVGIISDSFNTLSSPTSAAEDVASGALPGPANPCGFTTPVEVLSDKETGDDEGRAMAQLVHGIAPGAKIIFADAGLSELGMGENVLKLAAAGADIIVDDIGWVMEAMYQKGFLSSTIERAKADYGVAYFTAAGNDTASATTGPSVGAPLSSWQTNKYRPMPCPEWVVVDAPAADGGIEQKSAAEQGLDCMDFDPTGNESAYDTLHTVPAPSNGETLSGSLAASVGEPILNITTNISAQLYTLPDGENPQRLAATSQSSPVSPGSYATYVLPPASEVRMVIVRLAHDDSADARLPAVYTRFGDGENFTERHFMGDNVHDWVGESAYGHAADGSAVSVGAVKWNDPTTMRWYSSIGPVTLLFEPALPLVDGPVTPAARLPEPLLVHAPQVVSVDGTQTTFFPAQDASGAWRFTGTSAAAPNAAAVAALGLSLRPALSGAELSDLVIATARTSVDGVPIANPYAPRFADEDVYGNGLVDALTLLDTITEQHPVVPAAPTGLRATERSADSFTVAWDALSIENERSAEAAAPVDRYVISLLVGDGSTGETLEASQLVGEPLPTSYSFTGLTADTQYTVQLTAFGVGDTVGASTTESVRTLSATVVPDGGQGGGGANEAAANGGSASPGAPTTSGQLSETGGSNQPLWFGIAGAVLLLVAGGVFVAARKRSRKVPTEENAPSE